MSLPLNLGSFLMALTNRMQRKGYYVISKKLLGHRRSCNFSLLPGTLAFRVLSHHPEDTMLEKPLVIVPDELSF